MEGAAAVHLRFNLLFFFFFLEKIIILKLLLGQIARPQSKLARGGWLQPWSRGTAAKFRSGHQISVSTALTDVESSEVGISYDHLTPFPSRMIGAPIE